MIWINFLHLYQPANADGHVIKEATDKSYARIIRAIEEHPKIKFNLNISGCLFLRWEELEYHDLIQSINKLIKKGQIDLTGTAAYHPILPLIPKKEVIRQIKTNEKILKKHFGNNFKPRGFFFPELAYSPDIARTIKRLGYKWLILDEIAFSGKLEPVNFKQVYKDPSSLKVILRSRKLSHSYVPETIIKMLDENKKLMKKNKLEKHEIAITATDAELYGLRHLDQTAEFEKLLKRRDVTTLTISEYVAKFPRPIPIRPPAHSWATNEGNIKRKEPFILWQEKSNTIQKKLWQLADLSYDTIEKNKKDKNYYWARWHLVRGLQSCTFWWASAKDFRLFGPLSWSPDEIERGSNELIRAIRALEDVTTRDTKMQAEKLYVEIKKMVWQRHWAYYWKKT